jgi:hypothetical protein
MITCGMEIEVRTNSAGVKYVYDVELWDCTSSVTRCSEAGSPDVWPAQLNSETSMEITLCLEAFGLTNTCTMENLVVTEGASHATEDLETPDGADHTDCDEVNGVTLAAKWVSEYSPNHPRTEIVD